MPEQFDYQYQIIDDPVYIEGIGLVVTVRDLKYDINHRIDTKRLEKLLGVTVNRADIKIGSRFKVGSSIPNNERNHVEQHWKRN